MRSFATHNKIAPMLLVTFWTLLFSLQAIASTDLSSINALDLLFSPSLTTQLQKKNATVTIDLEFYDQRWEDEDFNPRHQALEMTRKINQLNAQYQQANQSLNSLALFNQQHPGMPALSETARTARAQAQELELKLAQLQQSATVKFHWKLSAKELNSGKASVDLPQILNTFKISLASGIDLKIKVSSSNFLFFKNHMAEWNGDLLSLIEQMKIDEFGQWRIQVSKDIQLIAYNKNQFNKLYASVNGK